MAMPKVVCILAATSPAIAKFGSSFLDRVGGLETKWQRTQEYVPVLVAGIACGMMKSNIYPDEALSAWNGSISIFADQLLNGSPHSPPITEKTVAKTKQETSTPLSREPRRYTNKEIYDITWDENLLPVKVIITRNAVQT